MTYSLDINSILSIIKLWPSRRSRLASNREAPMDPTSLPAPTSTQLATRPATPLERLCLPPELSGAAGTNRAEAADAQIAAQDDVAAITAWLARYADSQATLQTYRRDVERLLLWAVQQRGKPLSSLTHEDLLLYQRFLADPQPAARWVMPPGKKLARSRRPH